MQCQECFESFVGSRCSCGWSAPSLGCDGARTRGGIKLCNWATASKLCNLLASGDQSYCNWHTEWERQLQFAPMQSEYEALRDWLTQFAPGERYGENPGQWWADPDTTIAVCHGMSSLPGRTEKQKRDRCREHWRIMGALRRGIYSEANQTQRDGQPVNP